MNISFCYAIKEPRYTTIRFIIDIANIIVNNITFNVLFLLIILGRYKYIGNNDNTYLNKLIEGITSTELFGTL